MTENYDDLSWLRESYVDLEWQQTREARRREMQKEIREARERQERQCRKARRKKIAAAVLGIFAAAVGTGVDIKTGKIPLENVLGRKKEPKTTAITAPAAVLTEAPKLATAQPAKPTFIATETSTSKATATQLPATETLVTIKRSQKKQNQKRR